MNFNDYIISESDFKFFDSLPKDEQILFMYDLICDEAYGAGSMDDDYETTDVVEETSNFDDVLDTLKSKLQSIVSSSISNKAPVNMLILHDKMIINSDSLALIKDTVNQMLLTGYVLSEEEITANQASVFHHQKYCKIYTILAKHKISFN